jgi:hypothetical protein
MNTGSAVALAVKPTPNAWTRLSELSAATVEVRAGRRRTLRALTDAETAEIEGLRRELKAWLVPKADVEDIRRAVMPLITSFACRDPGQAVVAQVEGYLIGLAGISRAALAASVVKVLRDEAGLADVHFAPSPAELRRLARPLDVQVQYQLERCDLLIGLPPPAAPAASLAPPTLETVQ